MNNKLFIFLLIVFETLTFNSFAQGDLYITPNRVVFEGRKQKEMLSLANTGKDTATYSISFVQRRMNEDGSFTIIEVPDEGAPFADAYLRIYPRQVTLAPNEGQTVVMQVRRTSDMKEGEYRSHLYFRSEKNYKPLGEERKDSVNTVSVNLIPIYGISIPIIIRTGNTEATTSMSGLKLETKDQENNITFTLHRTGNSSVYGDFVVEYIPDRGKSIQVGAANGVAVYTNLNKRNMPIKLQLTPEMDLSNGKIKVSYVGRDDRKVMSEAELQL